MNSGIQNPSSSEQVTQKTETNPETSISPKVIQQTGHITYTLKEDSFPKTSEGTAAKAEIKAALDQAAKEAQDLIDGKQ